MMKEAINDSKVILGTVQLGMSYGINNEYGKPSIDEAFKILNAAKELGIRKIDTAEVYGESQKIIGSYHKNQDKFEILTKFILDDQQSIDKLLEKTLNKLNVKCLNVYSFHSFKDLIEKKSGLQLRGLKERGLIKNIGVSIYTADEFIHAINVEDVDVIQMPFNALDNYKINGNLIRKAVIRGKKIHARSIFLQGLFFMKENLFPVKLNSLIEPIRKLKDIACRNQMNMAELAISYALSFEEIDGVLLGVESELQLRENMKYASKTLNAETIDEIHSIEIDKRELLDPRNWK